MLRFGIERARRLVEQQDRRVAQNGAGDCKALTLPAREAHALLAEKGSEAAWQGVEEFGRMRRLSGGADLRLCAPGRPKPIFSHASAPKITGSCGTNPMRLRTSAGSAARRSTPSIRTAPCCGS